MKVTLLGVMGSVPGGTSDLGKNTTSILIEDGHHQLVIDAGTGIMKYATNSNDNTHHIILTHYHLDHILGLPYINELYSSNSVFHMYGPLLEENDTKSIFNLLFKEPLLPIPQDSIQSKIHHHVLEENQSYDINQFKVSTMLVEHPGQCMVYAIEKNGKKVTILTDFPNNKEDSIKAIKFSKNSDCLYIDGYIKEDELQQYSDYGHCTIESAISIFKESKSKKLILSHHRSDRQYDTIKEYETDCIIIAKEDYTFTV